MTKLPHEQLADDLMAAGLPEMSFAARHYRYHDFRSHLEAPAITLAKEISDAGRKNTDPERDKLLRAIYDKHMRGEYDATKEESDEWAAGVINDGENW